MSIKSDRWIEKMSREEGMISPFAPRKKRQRTISYGLSSYGYDMRLADDFQVFSSLNSSQLDPKQVSAASFQKVQAESLLVPPNSFVLGRSVEYFKIPRSILTICLGKSTYARCGVVVNVTPFEPEWEGFATISISNTAPLPVKLYANEGVAQIIFLEASELCRTSYADTRGKYQAQKAITGAKV